MIAETRHELAELCAKFELENPMDESAVTIQVTTPALPVEPARPVMTYDPERTNNAKAIADCVTLGYIRPTDRVLDCTYGLGRFWRTYEHPEGLIVASDVDPERSPIGYAVDACAMPWGDGEFDVTVCDPPYKLNGTPNSGGPAAMDADYGVAEASTWQDRHVIMGAMLSEALRVTKPRGIVLFKCMDQVVSGKIRFQTMIFATQAEEQGAELVAQLHVPGYRPQPAGRAQKNPRSNYSTLLVLRRGRSWTPLAPAATVEAPTEEQGMVYRLITTTGRVIDTESGQPVTALAAGERVNYAQPVGGAESDEDREWFKTNVVPLMVKP